MNDELLRRLQSAPKDQEVRFTPEEAEQLRLEAFRQQQANTAGFALNRKQRRRLRRRG